MATATTPQTVYDASEIDGMIIPTEKARPTKDIWGEPIAISKVRVQHFDATGEEGSKNYRAAHDSPIATCTSLSTGEEFEAWLPDRYAGRFTAHFGAHPDTIIQGRFFKDPVVNGVELNGWQFLGVDVIPEDKVNKNQTENPADNLLT